MPFTYTDAAGIEHISNCLDWWKENCSRFPILFKLMKKTLCIQATSAASERTFSAAGLTIANNRSRLTGDYAAAQICIAAYYPNLRLMEERKRAGAGVYN